MGRMTKQPNPRLAVVQKALDAAGFERIDAVKVTPRAEIHRYTNGTTVLLVEARWHLGTPGGIEVYGPISEGNSMDALVAEIERRKA